MRRARHAGGEGGVDLARFRDWTRVEVRYSDLDAQSHVNNAVYFTYFEQARVAYFARMRALEPASAAGGTQPLSATDITFVIERATCVYRRPISALRPVAVGVRCTRAGHSFMELEYVVCDEPGGAVHASGGTTVVSVDLASGRPRALPAWVRSALETSEGTQASGSSAAGDGGGT